MEPRVILIACAPGISSDEADSLEAMLVEHLKDPDAFGVVVNYSVAFQRISADDLPHKVFTLPGAPAEIVNKFYNDLKTKDVVVVPYTIGIADLREA